MRTTCLLVKLSEYWLTLIISVKNRLFCKKSIVYLKDYTVLRIFSINGTKLIEVREQQFPLEREIQRLTEANLRDLLFYIGIILFFLLFFFFLRLSL
jgi:hypothetical protein